MDDEFLHVFVDVILEYCYEYAIIKPKFTNFGIMYNIVSTFVASYRKKQIRNELIDKIGDKEKVKEYLKTDPFQKATSVWRQRAHLLFVESL